MSGLGFTHWGTLVTIAVGVSFCTIDYASAQITPDGTLLNNSSVTREGNTFNITGGTQAGGNLFHSFGEFSVNTGGTASFNNALDIQNIISRVTGGSVSNIDGIIRTLGTANLFLINPNGIIFGRNARLEIGGSFLASTASSFKFPNNLEFSAKTPQSAPLLSVNVPLGLQYEANPGSIINQSQAIDSNGEIVGLQVLANKTLALIGGDVVIEGGSLIAPSGRIELGSIADNSFVSLASNDTGYVLNYEGIEKFKDIRLTQAAYVATDGDTGGSIQVQSANATLTDGAIISASTSGKGTGIGITLNTTQSVQLIGSSTAGLYPTALLVNSDRNATGNAGNLAINTSELLIQDGAQVTASTFGSGKGGNLNVTANKVQVIGGSSSLGSLAQSGSTGDAGNLTINTSELLIQNGGQVGSSIFESGNGGSLNVTANKVQVIGGASDDLFSSLGSLASSGSRGNAGNFTINTGELLIQDGGKVGSSMFGSGRGGNLNVTANKVQVISGPSDDIFSSLGSQASSGSTGNAGNLNINTNELLIQGRAQVTASTFGSGNAGKLNINSGELLIQDGGVVTASTYGSGRGGNLNVTANKVQIIGRFSDDLFSSLTSKAQSGSTGDAGDLTIKTNTLLVKDGAQVSTGTFGVGKGGNLTVDAQDVQIIGTNADSSILSALATSASQNLTGDAGDLTIKTNTLLVKDGAQVSTGTFGVGKGGNLTVDAQDVQIIGTNADGSIFSGLFTSTSQNSTGDAGNLTIKTNTLLVKDGAEVSAGTSGVGKGGNLTVDAQDVQIISGKLSTNAVSNSTGDAGDLNIKTHTLLLKDGAQVSASTFSGGDGGNLSVDAQDVQIIGTTFDGQFPSGLFASAQRNSTGDAGDLTIKTNTLLVQDGAAITVRSFGTGTAGNMTLNAPSIRLDNNALLSGDTQSAKVDPNREQATININSKILTMSRNSKIRTNAGGENVIGGNINIDTDFLIAFKNSDISANSTNFRGGNVRINAQGIFGTQFRDVASDSTSDITATGASPEFSGSVELNTPGIDPNSGLVDLPTVAVDTQIAQGCYSPGYAQNSFIITGRGGLPPNPREAFSSNIVRPEWATLGPSNDINSQQTIKENPPIPIRPAPIVEATGWGTNAKGEIVLTANASTGTPHKNWQQSPVTCSSAKSADN